MNPRQRDGLKDVVLWPAVVGALAVGILIGHFYGGSSFTTPAAQTRMPLSESWEDAALANASAGGAAAGQEYLFQIPNYGFLGPMEWNCLPDGVQSELLMNGQVEQQDWFLFDDGQWATGQPVERSTPKRSWSDELVQDYVARARAKDYSQFSYGPQASIDLSAAMEAHSVAGKSVLVVGTQSPWVEALVLAAGGSHVTTTDFNIRTLEREYPWWTLIHVNDLDARKHKFDAIISFSSLEHDGLGRYGDPINPNGDLERMRVLRNFVNPGGYFFLAVPLGSDALWYNAHRVYGKARLPKLIEGWEYLGIYQNYNLDEILSEPVKRDFVQPVLALRAT